MALQVEVGHYYDSYEEFMSLLCRRKDELNEHLVIGRSSVSVKAANAKLKREFKFREELRYRNVVFRCVHQGTFSSRGDTRQSTSLKNGCPVHIKLVADKHCNKLRVVSVELVHSHVLPAKEDGVYASDRRLDATDKAEVKKLMDLGAPVRKIQDFISTSTGKSVKCKDLHNLKLRCDQQAAGGRTVEERVWAVLEQMVKDDSGAHYRVFTYDETVNVVFIQTSHMRRMLQNYPDVLYIDTTYCLNSFGYPVVVFLIVDGNNVGHCVGYACVKDERMVTFSVLFGEFVRLNEGVNIKTVVVDKDASEIAAVRQTMPNCALVLCRFHVCKSLFDAVRKYCAKGDQEKMQGCMMKLVRCSSEEVFWATFNSVPDGLLRTYLAKNWIPVCQTWANFATKLLITWGNKTNNFVERHNRTLKSIASSKTSLPEFFDKLLSFHRQQETSLRQEVRGMALRTKVYRQEGSESQAILKQAHEHLTTYACSEIQRGLNEMKDRDFTFDSESKLLTTGISDSDSFDLSNGHCRCLYFVEKGLPCWHLLVMYVSDGVNVVDTVPDRYRIDRMVQCVDVVDQGVTGGGGTGRLSVVARSGQKSEMEKRFILKEVCRELVSFGSRCGQRVFERRLGLLRSLVARWRTGVEANVEDCLEFGDDMVAVEEVGGVEGETGVGRVEGETGGGGVEGETGGGGVEGETGGGGVEGETGGGGVEGETGVGRVEGETGGGGVEGETGVGRVEGETGGVEGETGGGGVEGETGGGGVEGETGGGGVEGETGGGGVEGETGGGRVEGETGGGRVQGETGSGRVECRVVRALGDHYRVFNGVGEVNPSAAFAESNTKGRPKGSGVTIFGQRTKVSKLQRKRRLCKLAKVARVEGEVVVVDDRVSNCDAFEGVNGGEAVAVLDRVEGEVDDGVSNGDVFEGVNGDEAVAVLDRVEGEVDDRVSNGDVFEGVNGGEAVAVLDRVEGEVDDRVSNGDVFEGVNGGDAVAVLDRVEGEVVDRVSNGDVFEGVNGGDAVAVLDRVEGEVVDRVSNGDVFEGVNGGDAVAVLDRVEGEVVAHANCVRRSKRTMKGRVLSNKKKVRFNDQVCAECLEEEVGKQYCVDGVFMEWIDCDRCHRWFHCHCVGLKQSVHDFVCSSCV